MIVDELIAVLGFDVRGEEKLRSFNASMEQAATRLAAFAVTAAVAGAAAMAAFGKSVIDVSAKFEQFQTSLETIEGSAAKAKQSMDWITDFAATTPYELQGVTEAFVRMKAYGIDPTDGTLRTLGDTASAMGKPLMQAVEAFADATNFQFERLREFGVTASQKGDQVTFQWTKNGKQLTEVVKKDGALIQKFLKEHFGEAFNGAMLRQSKTWTGMMSNLSDSWMIFQKKVGDAGFFESVKGRLAQLLDYIGDLSKNGSIDRFAKTLSKAFEGAADGVVLVIARLVRHFKALSDWSDKYPNLFGTIADGLKLIAAVKFPWITALIFLEDFMSAMEGGDSVIGDLGKALQEFADGDFTKAFDHFDSIKAAGLGVAAAAVAFRGFSASLWPVAAGLAAVGAAYWLAKGIFDKLEADATKTKAVANPRTKPGYVEGSGDDRTGYNSNNSGGYLKPSDYGSGFEDAKQRMVDAEARRVGADKPLRRKPTAFDLLGSDYIPSGMIENAARNFGRMGSSGAAAAINSTVNDNSGDRSVNVTVNQTIQQASQAPGAAAQATANAVASSGAKRATWHELGEKF